MFNKVLIGVDETPAAHDAIKLARDLVSPRGELVLAHVHGGFPIYAKGMAAAFLLDQQEQARKLLASLSRRTGITETVTIGDTGVGRGLHALVEREHADLLVLGSTRRGLVGRVLLGDETRDATHGSPCPVAIAPIGYSKHTHSFREIGVAYNETDESRHALAVARRLAEGHHAKLSAFEAIPLQASLVYGFQIPYREIADDWTEEARQRMDELGGFEPHVALGDPADELTTYSSLVDLLVVGSRDFGPFGRLMHSSTSTRLSRTAHCPLLILTRPVREQAAAEAAADQHRQPAAV